MSAGLSDERSASVEALCDFAARECGAREQRDRLTDGGREVPSPSSMRSSRSSATWA